MRIKLLALLIALSTNSFASPFKIQDIRVEGLQRVAASTVFAYLPVKPNNNFDINDSFQTSEIIHNLYNSRLFSNIRLKQENNILVIQLTEYPVISAINLKGNKDIRTDDIKKAFESVHFIEGQSFNPAMLKTIINELDKQYQTRGKYSVLIDAAVKEIGSGKVAIDINIKEGKSGRIKELNFIGNKIYSDSYLAELFDTNTTKWNSWLTKSDIYQAAKMNADLERLEQFYLNRGFIDFYIRSTQTTLSKNLDELSIIVNLHEGDVYRISDYKIVGNLIVPDLNKLIQFKKGDLFNKSLIDLSIKKIKTRLADEGFANTDIQLIPEKDKLTKQVKLTFVVNPNNRTYVRRINFTGNEKGYDIVFRREMRQKEGALYSSSDLTRSLGRLRRLPQIEDIEQVIHPVSADQVDIEYKITERKTNSISGGIGYGQSTGALFSVNYKDENFFGTGYQLGVDFGRSSSQTSYGIDFTDPYLTSDGISASYRLDYNSYNYEKKDISDWASDTWEASTLFGYPLSEYQRLYAGGGIRGIKIKAGLNAAPEISQYLKENGNRYTEPFINLALSKDSLNNQFLPSKGFYNRIGAEFVLPTNSDRYYKLNYQHRSYFGFGEETRETFIIGLRGEFRYGDSLPFYRHYYSGGIGSVRGFEYSSLGPKFSDNSAAGGDFAVDGGIEFIIPARFTQRSNNLRFGAFFDFGNVYDKFDSFKANDLRYSTGIFMHWVSPIGPLNISYGKPLNAKKGDRRENLQFTIGTVF